jgi:hypothetical protein
MFLLQLPVWSYIVIGASLLAAVAALTFLLRARRDKQVDNRRAHAAAGVLRILNDEQAKRRSGNQSSLTIIPAPEKVEHHRVRLRPEADINALARRPRTPRRARSSRRLISVLT